MFIAGGDFLMKKEYKKACLIIGTTLGVYLILEYIFPLVVPFLFAYLITKATLPLVSFLNIKLKLPKMLGCAITLVLFAGTLGYALFRLIKTLMVQGVMLIKNMPVYLSGITKQLDIMCNGCDYFFGLIGGSAREYVDENINTMLIRVKTEAMPIMTEGTFLILLWMGGIMGVIFIVFISVLMIVKDMDSLRASYEESMFYQEVHPVASRLTKMGLAYLRAQSIIICIIAVICTGGLILFGNRYALLIGVAIGVFDAFPVLGSGLLLVPWALFRLMQGDIFGAAILSTIYLCCQLIRQILEPKLLGDRIGIKPIYTIMAIYAGIQIFGISGFFLGPIALVVTLAIVQNQV